MKTKQEIKEEFRDFLRTTNLEADFLDTYWLISNRTYKGLKNFLLNQLCCDWLCEHYKTYLSLHNFLYEVYNELSIERWDRELPDLILKTIFRLQSFSNRVHWNLTFENNYTLEAYTGNFLGDGDSYFLCPGIVRDEINPFLDYLNQEERERQLKEEKKANALKKLTSEEKELLGL